MKKYLKPSCIPVLVDSVLLVASVMSPNDEVGDTGTICSKPNNCITENDEEEVFNW